MRRAVTNALFFGAGAATGALTAYLALNKALNARVDAEIADMKNYYEKKASALSQIDIPKESTEEAAEPEKPEFSEEEIKKYDEIADTYDTPVRKTRKKKAKVSKTDNSGVKMMPYIISEAEYDESNGFDKVILSFFEDDEIVMDENEEVVTEAIDILGDANLSALRDNTVIEGEIFIRNEQYGTDYQVVLESGSYQNFLENNEE